MVDVLTLTLNPALDVWTHTDSLVPSRKLRCAPALQHPGGGGINVARVLQRLGADCVAWCALGGANGQRVAELLAQDGVATRVLPIAGETRENFTVRVGADAQEFRFVLPGPQLRTEEWQDCLQQLSELNPVPQYLVISGSLPPGVPDDFLARAAQIARTVGSRLVVDCSGPPLAAALSEGVFLVKPSLRELREISAEPLETLPDIQRAAMQWVRARKAEVVVVSMGEQGALLASAAACFLAQPLSVGVVSAVGAGDSLVAGMVWAFLQGMDVADVLRWGSACGAVAVQQQGTGLCHRADVQEVLPQVQVVPLPM